jgi:diguanylate cyclase (GGDEF)-like protein
MQVDQTWDQALREQSPFSLMMIDVDNFKKYNDHYGHLAGDDCLRSISACLASTIQQANDDKLTINAFVARYGGEEFCVVVPEAPCGTHVGVAEALVESIAMLNLPHEKNGDWGKVTISVGAVCVAPACDKVGALFRDADTLLYKAKENGRNRAESN